MMIRALRRALFACAAGVMLTPASALAYTVGTGSTASGPTAIAGGVPFTFTVRFVQPDGTPEPAGLGVTFSEVSGPTTASVAPAVLRIHGGDQAVTLAATTCVVTFNPVSTVTDANGTASTIVTLPPGCPGLFVLAATLTGPGVTGSATLTFSIVELGGFPNTTGDPSGRPSWWQDVLVVALVAVAAAGAARLWSVGRGRWS